MCIRRDAIRYSIRSSRCLTDVAAFAISTMRYARNTTIWRRANTQLHQCAPKKSAKTSDAKRAKRAKKARRNFMYYLSHYRLIINIKTHHSSEAQVFSFFDGVERRRGRDEMDQKIKKQRAKKTQPKLTKMLISRDCAIRSIRNAWIISK